jgi:hypothetical protein
MSLIASITIGGYAIVIGDILITSTNNEEKNTIDLPTALKKIDE